MNTSEKITKIHHFADNMERILHLMQALMIGVTALICLAWIAGFDVSFEPAAVLSATGSVLLALLDALLMILKWVLCFAILQIARGVTRDVADHETPFESIQVQRLRRIALLCLLNSFSLSGIQLGSLIAALVLGFAALVLDYGCLLQQESDETL